MPDGQVLVHVNVSGGVVKQANVNEGVYWAQNPWPDSIDRIYSREADGSYSNSVSRMNYAGGNVDTPSFRMAGHAKGDPVASEADLIKNLADLVEKNPSYVLQVNGKTIEPKDLTEVVRDLEKVQKELMATQKEVQEKARIAEVEARLKELVGDGLTLVPDKIRVDMSNVISRGEADLDSSKLNKTYEPALWEIRMKHKFGITD